MKDGTFKKEGTISKLKSDYGGFSVKLKLKGKSGYLGFDEVDSPERVRETSTSTNKTDVNNINIIKQEVEECFKGKADECEIKDEHSVSIIITQLYNLTK